MSDKNPDSIDYSEFMKTAIRTGVAGWKQFLVAKWDIVQAYERAKQYSQAHKVQTSHGNVAAASFRSWLERFLPKRFGVCNGYIASQQLKEPHKFPHFDIIIFDQMNSPILWLEENMDTSSPAMARAIPAEYVQCVMEIKSRLNPTNAREAIDHLKLLEPLFPKNGQPKSHLSTSLPNNFCMFAVFMELLENEQYSEAILTELRQYIPYFYGAIALKGEGLNIDLTWRSVLMTSKHTIESQIGKNKRHLLERNMVWGEGIQLADKSFLANSGEWNENNFARFAFDLLAIMNGTYVPNKISSWYGFSHWTKGPE